MTDALVSERIWELVRDFDLHCNGPHDWVRLDPLEDWFPIVRRPLKEHGIMGYVVPPSGQISASNPAPIALADHLPRHVARWVYAHEIGHALYGHEGAVSGVDPSEWQLDRDEWQAWKAAAQLLIPFEAVCYWQEKQRIASAMQVPVWLVELVR